jgi:hypothetical protein
MTITLNEDYDVTLSTALLGYVGETNARPVTIEGMEIDGADRYVLTIDYGCGVEYEVDITGGQWTPTADILRSAQTVSCQIAAKKLSGQEYILVKKSRIFRLRIGAAIGDNAIPSPSVAADALDRIDSIGRQAHADMQTAVTAAETATTAAKNAEKSATTAGVSADTAEQAASRAETAKTSAETSAIQADTARQGAETARAEAVKSQNSAKVSAAQASVSAQQTEADKNITAGYAKTAKTNAGSTAADRQAVQTLAEQVTADKATVADSAAKVAADRIAAEAAAQTAQAVVDSLPDDYVTAVAKISENTAEIGRVKLTDKELQRRVNALYDIGQGVTHKFETDTDTAYQKAVPTGAKLMSVKKVGGRSIVFNQLCDIGLENFSETVSAAYHEYGICKFTANVGDKICIYSGGINGTYAANGAYVAGFIGETYIEFWGKQIVQVTGNGNCIVYLRLRGNGNTYDNVSARPEIFNLTKMFGAGNEPSTVEEFEKMFPSDYYPYNAGEIVSAGTEEVAVGDTACTIPEAIRNLPGYGWSAGTAKNYVDYENKRYVQCVDSVDLGTLTWTAGESVSFKTHHLAGQKLTKSYSIAPNFICPKYSTKTQNESWGKTSITGISATSNVNGYIYVNDTSYADAAAFKQAMQGVMLYYELETPIVTDISSLIPDDFLRNLTVEAGGSITFQNSNGDSYRILVPSEEEYIVKLSEVGGTT